MEYIVTGNEMKLLDNTTSDRFGVPSVVLMEQAALGVVRELVAYIKKEKRIAVICGKGNNAGDGIAIARLLRQAGYDAYVHYIFGEKSCGSELFELQKKIYKNYGFPVINDISDVAECDVVIDAVFGTGLQRDISGECKKAIGILNEASGYRIAIDAPSGVDCDNGHILGIAFKADVTYTFSYKKTGLLLWPGCDCCGEVKVVKIGIDDHSFCENVPQLRALTKDDLCDMPKRPSHSNKGTFGKLLVIAGSYNMAGAAVLAAKAAYKSGAGLVKVLTPKENRTIIQCSVPEALLDTYDNIESSLTWASAIVLGPGIGKGEAAHDIVKHVLKEADVPILIDADALNIISEDTDILKNHKMPVIVTPHLGEMSRLMGISIADIQKDVIGTARKFAAEYDVVCLLKDSRSITAYPDGISYINLSGNSGMATAGSGDVLSGITGALLAQWQDAKKAAVYGAYIHGLAGDEEFDKMGSHGMIASDIINGLDKIWIKVK